MTMTARTTSGRARRRRATARHVLLVAAGLRVVALCLAAASLSTIDASYRLVSPALAAEGDHGNGKGNGNGSGQGNGNGQSNGNGGGQGSGSGQGTGNGSGSGSGQGTGNGSGTGGGQGDGGGN